MFSSRLSGPAEGIGWGSALPEATRTVRRRGRGADDFAKLILAMPGGQSMVLPRAAAILHGSLDGHPQHRHNDSLGERSRGPSTESQ